MVQMENQRLRFLLTIFSFSILVGCQSVQRIDAPLVVTNSLIHQLDAFPPPKMKVPIAVYSFTDVTGQRKPNQSVAQISTAVTQGSHIWLIQALKRAGNGEWFQVVERVALDNLLKERQIIRQTRESFGDKDQITPLLFAGVLIEGGIVGYDANTTTGGFGARLLGIGSSVEYRKDTVTVGIRLVSVGTGEILMAISSEKTILSTRVSANVFKFLDMGTKLLETEVGYTENESVTYAVRKAIEKVVTELIIKGAERGLWEFNEPDTPVVIVSEEYHDNNENDENNINFNDNEIHENYTYREGE